ncbi:MAG: polynucleotide adenylyltransferase PcnB [Myxococcales bacterium]|nr:MAG: polynucleotide adenylyltransferase PcnB [Myxococcales bacterium]
MVKKKLDNPKVYPKRFDPELLDSDAISVTKELNARGYDAYLVGGCVRDLLLGHKPKDFDVATNALPEQVKASFRRCRIIGRRFRLAHVVFGREKVIEVATYRKDPSASNDGSDAGDLLIRHDNVFGNAEEDALRRDFTINALYYDVKRQEVIDYVDGMPDLDTPVIRTIGFPGIRFQEDPVRMLRAVKFAARLDAGIAPEVYEAMVFFRDELARAAKPRLFEELLKLLRCGASQRAFYLLWDSGLLSVILPELMPYVEEQSVHDYRIWQRLAEIDKAATQGTLYDEAVLMNALFFDALVETLQVRVIVSKLSKSFLNRLLHDLSYQDVYVTVC